MFLPELYDLVNYKDKDKVSQYYNQNRVFSLSEYAIISLGNHYKYTLLPHFIVRGGYGEDRWSILNILRELRIAVFFKEYNFIDIYNELCLQFQIIETYIYSN